jgi:glycosyltransferase involved in cell wall biosynthesis
LILQLVFWTSASIVLFVYAGYPALLWLLARIFGRPVKKSAIRPRVSLVVAAYNEERVIQAKIRNALQLDYPPEKLEIVIASDGSTDRTVELASALADDSRVRVIAFSRNRGKLAVLNDVARQLRGEIIAFSDASSMLEPDALARLVESFADRSIGAVSGVYRVKKQHEAALGAQEDLYWKYETFLKSQEAALDSPIGAHGSLYAIRRELYPFPELTTINDDTVIPVRIVQRGYRLAYETAALAVEEAREMGGFSRRVRIMTGNVDQLREIRHLLTRPAPLFFFLVHKVGRLAAPLCLAVLAAVTIPLAVSSPMYLYLGVLQAAFYALAAAGGLWKLQPKVLRLPYYFIMVNAAAFLGFYYGTIGRNRLVWKKNAAASG